MKESGAEVTEDTMKEFLDAADIDKSGCINYQELLRHMENLFAQ
jgi:hypothetical protein